MRWLTDDWHYLLPRPWASVALVLVAVVCGGIVGVELERRRKAVGYRTLALVSLGSTVFMMITATLDYRTPIAAQVVSGIGFLGAGVILRGPFGITGLNSAATIWAMSAVGMTVGLGYAGAGLALSVFLLVSTRGIAAWEQHHIGLCRYRWAVLTFRVDGGKTLIKIEEALDEFRFPREGCEVIPTGGAIGDKPSHGQVRLHYCDVHQQHREFLAFLAGMNEIEEIRRMDPDADTPP